MWGNVGIEVTATFLRGRYLTTELIQNPCSDFVSLNYLFLEKIGILIITLNSAYHGHTISIDYINE